MFFTLAKEPDHRLPNHVAVGNWVFSYDNGWIPVDTNVWFKGYQHNQLDQGNWTKIICENSHIKVLHDNARSYPLWWDKSQLILTNLLGNGQRIYADENIELGYIEAYITKRPQHTSTLSTSTVDQVVDKLYKNLTTKTQELSDIFNTIPKKLFVSGGIDTVILLGLIKQQSIDCEIIDYEYFEYDQFTNKNWFFLKRQHWAYGQIHHWTKPTVLITGACGDEFLMRGPNTVGTWAAWNGINLNKWLEGRTGYHANYYALEKNKQLFDRIWTTVSTFKKIYPEKNNLIDYIVDCNLNDHQHWHLGNTLTWTPFKDIELTKLMLTLSVDDMLDHILDATVTKRLILRLHPELINVLSDDKNINGRQHVDLINQLIW